jgi:hypothetical protein
MNISITYPTVEGLNWSKLAESLGPHLLWAVLIIGVILFIGPRKIAAALLNARKIGFAGVEIEFKGYLAEAAAAKNIDLPLQSQDQVSRRIQRLCLLFAGSRFLWIDDNPASNVNEIRLLRRLGAMIDLATDDAEARRQFSGAVYDIVISDMGRGQNPDAGEMLIPEIGRAILAPILIFYVGQDRPAPPGALGLTVRPDELFNLILDALERRRA